MPIAAFTFGSFGDITAILQLAWAIRQSLSETGGAVAQVQMLITDIDTFTRALQQIKSALETRASVPGDLMNGIALALEQCFKLLLRVKQRIDAYNSRITGAVGVGVLRHYWAAVAWEILGGKNEVDALRKRLSEQVEVIQTLLAAAHRCVLRYCSSCRLKLEHCIVRTSTRFAGLQQHTVRSSTTSGRTLKVHIAM
ncbi:hypothetical protein EXIGLDRAFT_290589 [Exidia glandulosa HHB12029]|uniref:Fungal N-terminal domain-containing protein n=1 Tax=Exidia glandulosa HHB12029 TaxID=1314781 RepID=A0A165DEX4_EXIGL|nr:hypothetical protein EXIGLDRAFT_290589 [Exidia glandulosa HHB12029]